MLHEDELQSQGERMDLLNTNVQLLVEGNVSLKERLAELTWQNELLKCNHATEVEILKFCIEKEKRKNCANNASASSVGRLEIESYSK